MNKEIDKICMRLTMVEGFFMYMCVYYIICDHIFMYQSNEIIYNKLTISQILYINSLRPCVYLSDTTILWQNRSLHFLWQNRPLLHFGATGRGGGETHASEVLKPRS